MSFTATLQRGADSCEAVKNHMARAPAPAELGNAAEPGVCHGEGAGGACTEGCEHMDAEDAQKMQQNVPRALQDTVRLR